MSLFLRLLPDPVLRQTCAPVTCFDRAVSDLAADMQRLMLAHKGIGLAAPQVGIRQRVVVVLIDHEPLVIVNPVIDHGRGISHLNEGCLSCPGILVRVQRQALVLFEGQAVNGQRVSYSFDRLLAHCIQHEIDHLHGRLILDHGEPIYAPGGPTP